nr:unnamed protein product [Callosobruchus analis]
MKKAGQHTSQKLSTELEQRAVILTPNDVVSQTSTPGRADCGLQDNEFIVQGRRIVDFQFLFNQLVELGSGFSHLEELCTSMDIPNMHKKKYMKEQDKVFDMYEQCSVELMANAAEEEKEMAIRDNEVGEDGVPEITVISDWNMGKTIV